MKTINVGLSGLVLSICVAATVAGPQHWGSGYPYLLTIERDAKGARLSAYEPPLRAKNSTWLRRWVDTNPLYGRVYPGGIAAGDFWPAGVSKEYVVLLTKSSGSVRVQLAGAPEMFGSMRWKWSAPTPLGVQGTVIQCATGDLLGQKRDQLLILSSTSRGRQIEVFGVSGTYEKASFARLAGIPVEAMVSGFVCGDFWGEGVDKIGLVTKNGITFSRYSNGRLHTVTTAKCSNAVPTLTVSADFVKDGFDVVAAPQKASAYRLLSAPLAPGKKKAQGPTYTGRALSGQPLPGFSGAGTTLTMAAKLDTRGATMAATAGRIFGYVEETPVSAIRKSHGIDPRPDAEIAFTSRFPLYSLYKGAPHFGWPLKGETFGYDVAVKNNGATSIPAGAKLTVWFGAKQRNADTNAATMLQPTQVITIKRPIPPFNPLKPDYVKIRVQGKWPYDLIPVSPEAPWKKVNLEAVGERWLVVKLDCQGDRTLRNNRYEAAFHAYTSHPIHRENTLADRVPTVLGDPCSLEYLNRKLADAVQCVWERSRTTKNEDVLQRAFADGYEIGFPDDAGSEQGRLDTWHRIQEWWEGWRCLDIWTGENQTWEKYDWSYSPELHETCHLFHPLGDLYGNYVMPVWLRGCTMADGTPVQMRTNLWGPDLFGSGHAIIGPNASELMKKYLVGARGSGMDPWWTVLPKQVRVQILDRNGAPAPNAEVTWWSDSHTGPIATGRTDASGCWDISSYFGKPSEPDKNGIRHYWGSQNGGITDFNAHLFTVKIGSYQDAAILGAEDVNAHSRLSLLYQAMVNPDRWTWQLKTNFAPGAPEPDFRLVSAVRGTEITIAVNGPKTAYRLYRRWEPAYIRENLGEFLAGGDSMPITQDMATADGYQAGRFRAIYEVTRVVNGKECLPRRISVCGLKNGKGVSAMEDGRLVVATNAGIANPFAVIFDGTTPAEEFFYHYRFGHTARKIVQSLKEPKRFYLTLTGSDTKPNYGFDIAEPNATGAYDVRNEMYDFDCVSANGMSMTLSNAAKAEQLHPGDYIHTGDADDFVRILDRKGAVITVDGRLFPEGAKQMRFNATRTAGVPGSNEVLRELKTPGGLACLLVDGKEYIAIADTGNKRLVVWDDSTGYITKYEDPDFTPMAVAVDPMLPSAFGVVGRTSTGGVSVRRLTFDGTTVSLVKDVLLTEASNSLTGALGIAIAKETNGPYYVAITDAESGKVLEYTAGGATMTMVNIYEEPRGVYSGNPRLQSPLDAAYVEKDGSLQLFALDSGDRLVRLR